MGQDILAGAKACPEHPWGCRRKDHEHLPSGSASATPGTRAQRSASKESSEAKEHQSGSPGRTAKWWLSGQVSRVRCIRSLVPVTRSGQSGRLFRSSRLRCPIVWSCGQSTRYRLAVRSVRSARSVKRQLTAVV